MSNQEAIEILQEEIKRTDWNTKYVGNYVEALRMGADAIKKLSYLTDIPCQACLFNDDREGCKRWTWTCVFEDDGKETE